jgi:hypothetical protein
MSNLARYDEVATTARKSGTVTPQYMAGGIEGSTRSIAATSSYDERTVPSRIRDCLPDVRLVAILRDPVERAVSHHRMIVTWGSERRSFDDTIDELLDPRALERARRYPQEVTGYITRGEYGRILAGYFDVFPREQILVVFTDELERAPAQVLSRIHEFIGVSADFRPDNLGERFRTGAIERGFSWRSPASWLSPSSPLSPQRVVARVSRSSAARTVWHRIPEDRQRRMGRRYERIAHRTAVRNRRHDANQVSANAEPSQATLTRLREHYEQDAGQLAALLGVDPPWQTSSRPR